VSGSLEREREEKRERQEKKRIEEEQKQEKKKRTGIINLRDLTKTRRKKKSLKKKLPSH